MNTELHLRQKIILMVAVAVLLRLLAMPFFMHMDLLSEFRRINYAMENLSFYPGFNRLTIFYIESLFYSITQWFVVNPDLLLHLPDPKHSTSSVTTHFIFAGDPHVFRHLFLFKLPYLVFDLLAARLIWCYFDGHKLRTIALAIWLFNPVTFYASYIFGRYDVISLFFICWTIFCLRRNTFLIAAVAFGLALNAREVNLIFVPAFILALACAWRCNIVTAKYLILACIIVVGFFCIPYLIEGLLNAKPLFIEASHKLQNSKGAAVFFTSPFDTILPFFLVSGICYLIFTSNRYTQPDQVFVIGGSAVILPFFMVGLQSAHYFSWSIPFLVLALLHNKSLLIPVLGILLCWFGFWLFNPQGAHFTPLLATPLHESFFGLGSFKQFYQTHIPHPTILSPNNLRDIFFTLTVACSAAILFRLVIQRENNANSR